MCGFDVTNPIRPVLEDFSWLSNPKLVISQNQEQIFEHTFFNILNFIKNYKFMLKEYKI